MPSEIQAEYESRLSGYANLIHGNAPPGLAAKLAIFRELLQQHKQWRDDLWHIEPLLFPLFKSSEVDLHLSIARLLERPQRSDRSLFKFLSFCEGNRANIIWANGELTSALIAEQLASLEAHRSTINAIMGRRDRFFAHLDKRYFTAPAAVYSDYPLDDDAVIALANAMIDIVQMHEQGLNGSASFHLAEFYMVAVDNMVRNLLTGRKTNFPNQLNHISG